MIKNPCSAFALHCPPLISQACELILKIQKLFLHFILFSEPISEPIAKNAALQLPIIIPPQKKYKFHTILTLSGKDIKKSRHHNGQEKNTTTLFMETILIKTLYF
jgi:hypothetical protein